MRLRRRAHRAAAAASRRLRQGAAALATCVATLTARVTYRRREMAVIALLSASVLGGFALEVWRARAPTLLDGLEAEPPRLVPASRSAASRAAPSRGGARAARARDPSGAPAGPPGRRLDPPVIDGPLDLNRASATDLARLPGIGPRLAERILARRAALGGRFRSRDDLATVPGLARKADALAALVTVDAARAGGQPPGDGP